MYGNYSNYRRFSKKGSKYKGKKSNYSKSGRKVKCVVKTYYR